MFQIIEGLRLITIQLQQLGPRIIPPGWRWACPAFCCSRGSSRAFIAISPLSNKNYCSKISLVGNNFPSLRKAD
jgi:hypothetical protein